MKFSMKKILTILFLGITLLPITIFANVEEDVWSYVFHLEDSSGVISVDKSVKFPYNLIPVEYASVGDISTTPNYGVVVSIKKVELAKFPIEKSTKIVPALGKGILDVHAPYFADADHVSFYSKSGSHLFDISVKSSSFCNDNSKCDNAVGENYVNCPFDCPAPTKELTPPAKTPINPSVPKEMPQPIIAVNEGASVAPIIPITTSQPIKSEEMPPLSTAAILSLVGGVLFIIFAFVLFRIRKNMD